MTLLRRQLLAKGLTARDLATKLKISPSAVHFWLTGVYLPRPKQIPKMARILDLDPMTLTHLLVPDAPGATVEVGAVKTQP